MTSNAQTAPHTGFFPRAPGPNLIVFVVLIGILPSAAATLFVLGRGVDGGHYMPQDFIDGQRQALLMIWATVSLAAVAALGFVLRAARLNGSATAGTIVLSVALVVALAWNGVFFLGIRSIIAPSLSASEVHDLAALEFRDGVTGPQRLSIDRRTAYLDIALSEPLRQTSIPMQSHGPILCRAMGRFFAGPIDVIGVRFMHDTADTQFLEIPRAQCRRWYLNNRRPSNRPQPVSDLAQGGSQLWMTVLSTPHTRASQ